jgi:hypothetical protein
MRQRGFESHPVLFVSLTIRLRKERAHDVAAAYRLAKAEVRVRLPLGTFLAATRPKKESRRAEKVVRRDNKTVVRSPAVYFLLPTF